MYIKTYIIYVYCAIYSTSFFVFRLCGCWSPQLFLFYLKGGKQMRVQRDGVVPFLSGNLCPLLFIDEASVACGIILDVQSINIRAHIYIYIYTRIYIYIYIHI